MPCDRPAAAWEVHRATSARKIHASWRRTEYSTDAAAPVLKSARPRPYDSLPSSILHFARDHLTRFITYRLMPAITPSAPSTGTLPSVEATRMVLPVEETAPRWERSTRIMSSFPVTSNSMFSKTGSSILPGTTAQAQCVIHGRCLSANYISISTDDTAMRDYVVPQFPAEYPRPAITVRAATRHPKAKDCASRIPGWQTPSASMALKRSGRWLTVRPRR